jgi:hypothetical protein
LELVKKYVYKKPINSKLFFEWLGVTENAFNFLIDQHRNKKIWTRNDNWEWELKFKLFETLSLNSDDLKQKESFKNFTITKKDQISDCTNKYILIGKGK